MNHIFLVMELPYDKDERPIMHGAFEDCYAAMTVFGIVANQLRAKAGMRLVFYTGADDVAHVEVDGGEYDRHCVVVERVSFTRRPEP
jgi:hypothetical protein